MTLFEKDVVNEFSGGYRFLSNFWDCYISFEGADYPSVENAYQAAKCANVKDRWLFRYVKPSEAKKLGRAITMRADWHVIKTSVMLGLVRLKFSDVKLAEKLLETGDVELQEGNRHGDIFWGTFNGVGENNLGKILMKVRSELRDERGLT